MAWRGIDVLYANAMWWLIVTCGCCPSPSQGSSLVLGMANPRGVAESSDNDWRQYEVVASHRDQVIESAIRRLEGAGGADEEELSECATALGRLRANDKRAIAALGSHLSVESLVVGEPGPLSGLSAANALSDIGGGKVADELIRALRQRRSNREILIIAHILRRSDAATIGLARVNAAINAETASDEPDKRYLKQLEDVRSWLERPMELGEYTNWPSNM